MPSDWPSTSRQRQGRWVVSTRWRRWVLKKLSITPPGANRRVKSSMLTSMPLARANGKRPSSACWQSGSTSDCQNASSCWRVVPAPRLAVDSATPPSMSLSGGGRRPATACSSRAPGAVRHGLPALRGGEHGLQLAVDVAERGERAGQRRRRACDPLDQILEVGEMRLDRLARHGRGRASAAPPARLPPASSWRAWRGARPCRRPDPRPSWRPWRPAWRARRRARCLRLLQLPAPARAAARSGWSRAPPRSSGAAAASCPPATGSGWY